MESNQIIAIQKKGITVHRLVYVIFLLQRLLLQFVIKEISARDNLIVSVFLLLCFIIEEVVYRFHYFNKVIVARFMRYIQCLLSIGMIVFLHIQQESAVMVIAILIMFIVDYFLTMEIIDKEKAIFYILAIGLPVIFVLVIKMSVSLDLQWMHLFFDILLLLMVICYEAYSFIQYLSRLDDVIYNQRHEFEQIVERNENILNMQEKLKNTNNQLNLQKFDLQEANKQIQLANQEMKTQTEILHYIATSFDVAKISNQITNAIMQIKDLDFCAVYIKENVYLNKHPHYDIKTNIGQFQSKMKDSMADIYNEMIERNETEMIYHFNIRERFPFLKDVNINSVFIKILGFDGDSYGLFIIGDSRRNLFLDNMSFYEAIIAQFDIAISNAQIYNDMQHMARKDGLTGINNRIYFNQLFSESVKHIVETEDYMSVALFDIDKFKSVNDTYGHLAGDEVIKCIAGIAEKCIEKYDGFVCRYGGEEFVAAMPGRKLEVAHSIIEELFETICKQVVEYNEYKIPISISVGLTAYPEVCKNPDELLKRADWSMYYAKEHGRHQIIVDDGSIEKNN